MSIIMMLGIVFSSFASDLVFQFTNPSFGGNPLYGAYLLQQAQIQDKFKESKAKALPKKSLLEQFQESLARQVMYQIAYRIVRQAFGEEELQAGSYQIGTFVINVAPMSGKIVVQIIDTSTGGETVIEVPYY